MTDALEYRIKLAKASHKQQMNMYEANIQDFREENKGRHEGCDYMLFRKEMLTGHRMAWNALNDLLRG